MNSKFLWTLLLVCGCTFGVLNGQDEALRIVSYSQDTIVKERDSLHINCHSNKPYSVCKFTLPGGTTCSLKSGESEKECGFGGRFNKTNPSFCGLDVKDVSSEFHGSYKCEIIVFEDGNTVSEAQDINVIVGQPADVEFVDIYGSVTVIVDKPNDFTCTGLYGRPAGEFIWRLGEKEDPNVIYFDNPAPLDIVTDENGYYKVSQIFNYKPEIEHNARNLYCIYEQKDHNQKVMFSQSDHIAFDVYYLKKPEAASIIPHVEVGEDFHMAYIFEAYPKPKIEDIIWQVKGGDDVDIELKAKNPRDPSIFMDGKYVLDPLRDESEHKFKIGFSVTNVTEEDMDRSYAVQISNRKKHSEDLVLSTVHSFSLRGNGSGGSSAGSTGTIMGIVIAVMLIFLLITLITLLVLTYKHKKWCFAPKDPPKRPGYDGDVEQPLNDLNDGGSSIIKPRS